MTITRTQSAGYQYYTPQAQANAIYDYSGLCQLDEAMQLSVPAPSPRATYVSGSTITYDVGKQRFNYCNHTKESFEEKDSCQVAVCRDAGSYHETRAFAYASAYPTRPASPELPVITDQLRKEAWTGLQPQLNTGLSMANFLFELRDIKHLLALAKKLSSMSRVYNKLSSVSRGSMTAAELTLAYGFGIAPMLSDIKKLCSLMFKTDKRIKEFIQEGKKLKTYHFTKDLSSTNQHVPCNLGRVETLTKSTYHATLKCRYDYKVPSKWKAFMRLYGLNITPEVIWNAIPFSFVVDWFVGIGKYLSQFDDDPNLKVFVNDYCDSIKTESIIREIRHKDAWYLQSTWTAGNKGFDGQVVWEWKRSHYIRQPGMPETGYALPVLDTLSYRELVLGGALLRTRI